MEQDDYLGGMACLMKQVCEAAGFAFSELWTRPSREVVAEEDGSTKVQWEYLLKWADITYINYEAFPEARHVAGKLDDLKEAGRQASYAKNNSIPGLAWNRRNTDWQDLSVYDRLDETLQADARTAKAMELFDASIALPLSRASGKTYAVLVFFRNRHVAQPAALCNRDEYYKHPALLDLLTQVYAVAPVAAEYERAKPRFTQALEDWCETHRKDSDVDAANNDESYGAFLDLALPDFVTKMSQAVTDNEPFRKLSAMEKEWEKGKFAGWLKTYIHKWKGTGAGPAPGTDWNYCKWVFFGCLSAIGTMTLIDDAVDDWYYGSFTVYALVTHFSAVALILFSTPTSPYGQPRNVIGGHLISATLALVLDSNKELLRMNQVVMNAFAPACAIGAMTWTGLMHPPAAACCLIFVSGGPRIKNLGYLYIFFPVLLDVSIMVFLALAINNLAPNRKYPVYW